MVKEFTKDAIIAILIVATMLLLIKPTIVRERSMMPMLNDGDYLILNKMAYMGERKPEHGDIIVFRHENSAEAERRLLVKRVIGTESDVITIEDGDVYRNSEKLSEEYIFTPHTRGEIVDFTVPSEHVYVLGDNREISLDSRNEAVGAVSEDAIIGKVALRLYPFNEITVF